MEINNYLEHKEKDTPNILLVKELYKALNGGDVEAIGRILTKTPTWNVCPGTPYGGTYIGMSEVFGTFYGNLMKTFGAFTGAPEVFIDSKDVVVALGYYIFKAREAGDDGRFRFSHTFKITSDNHIDGVWQVCDSYEMRKFLEFV